MTHTCVWECGLFAGSWLWETAQQVFPRMRIAIWGRWRVEKEVSYRVQRTGDADHSTCVTRRTRVVCKQVWELKPNLKAREEKHVSWEPALSLSNLEACEERHVSWEPALSLSNLEACEVRHVSWEPTLSLSVCHIPEINCNNKAEILGKKHKFLLLQYYKKFISYTYK